MQKAKISFEKELKMKKKNLQVKKPEKRSLKDVTSRISHLDQVFLTKLRCKINLLVDSGFLYGFLLYSHLLFGNFILSN